MRVDPPARHPDDDAARCRRRSWPRREQRSRSGARSATTLPLAPVPVRAELVYAFGPEWIDIGPSRLATPDTYVEFEGRTAYGDRSRIPFHVTSADWQESDRVFAGVLTAFGSRTGASRSAATARSTA